MGFLDGFFLQFKFVTYVKIALARRKRDQLGVRVCNMVNISVSSIFDIVKFRKILLIGAQLVHICNNTDEH